MDAFQQPLMRVGESAQWFLVAPEIRLFHIVTSASLRLAVLEQLAVAEHSSLNRTPFVVLEAPVEEDDDGWSLRAAELYDDWEQLRELYAKRDQPIVLTRVDEEVAAPGLSGFGTRLQMMLDAVPGPAAGLTVIVAPVWNNAEDSWREDVAALIEQPELGRARFVVVDLENDSLGSIRDGLGRAAEFVDARVDVEEARREARGMTASVASAPPGADAARLAGMAGPRVAPPPRWNAPAPLEPDELGRVYFDAQMASGLSDQAKVQELKACLLQAGDDAQQGNYPAALSAQRRARDLAVEMGLEREAIIMQIVLGTYLLQSGDYPQAEASYDKARELAFGEYHPDLGVQAQLAMAAAQLVGRRTEEAAATYSAAGSLAHQVGEHVLSIEAYRIAGQVHAADNRVDDAGTAWRAALTVADAAGLDVRKASTALEAAESLSELCRNQGLEAQADALDMHVALLRSELEDAPAEGAN